MVYSGMLAKKDWLELSGTLANIHLLYPSGTLAKKDWLELSGTLSNILTFTISEDLE